MNQVTLIEAAAWPVEELLGTHGPTFMCSIDITPAKLRATADAWCWLLGLRPGADPAAEDANYEAMTDGDLCLALNRPIDDWLQWWKLIDWGDFDRTERQGDAWCWIVMARSMWLKAHAGPVAGQLSTVRLVQRFGAGLPAGQPVGLAP